MTGTPKEEASLPPAAIEALRRGNKIEAIKIVRVERNLGLKEARAAWRTMSAATPR